MSKMADPEGQYYDEDELRNPEASDQSDYEAPESPFMPQINEAQEETHASYARLWEQYSSEQGQGETTDEDLEPATDEGMEFAEETPEDINRGGGMSAAA